jgi:alpha-galactosidase
MIHFNPSTQTFNLVLATSFYAFQVDAQGRLVHLGWGPRPAGAGDADLLSVQEPWERTDTTASFETQTQPDELLTFGDVTFHEVSLKVEFSSLPIPLAPGEVAYLPIRDVRLRYTGHEIVTNAQPGLAPSHGLPTAVDSARETLRMHLHDPVQPFGITLCYRLTPEHDIIERWCELENEGGASIRVELLNFAALHLPRGANELTAVSGAWAREFATQRERLTPGIRLLEHRTLQTGHANNPFFLLNRPGQAWEESGIVYFGALAYSGAWRIAFEHLSTLDVRVHPGYNPFEFDLVLGPGERHITPAVVCGVSAEGWGGASRRLHAFTRERVLPRPAEAPRFRPVLYNSWEATWFDVNHAGQAELARKAAAIGVELFCVDDGWFGARRNDRAGLGDWMVSPDAFPNGLRPLADEVHRLGMQFGLWFEPEMVNADSELYRQHPDWVLHFPGRPRSEARNQLVLDLGRPEVVAYLHAALDRLVSELGIDFIKWDMNRYASEPGSAAGKAIWRVHVAAVYDIMDCLRRGHPGLAIQSCSGGGGRIDLGILARAEQVWVSDNTDAFERMRIQEGFSLAYPARAMEAWVTETHNTLTDRHSRLNTRFDVAMRGALGIGSNLTQFDAAELAEYAAYIAFYKRIRPVVQEGALYRLERLEEFGASVIEYVARDGRGAVYSVAVHEHRVGEFRPPPALRGLNTGGMYAVFDFRGVPICLATGYELMTQGIPGDAAGGAGHSRTLYLEQV